MSMAGTEVEPVLILNATEFDNASILSTYVVALDLNTATLLWKVGIPTESFIPGQFPIVTDVNGSRVFFSSLKDGVWVIGAPGQE